MWNRRLGRTADHRKALLRNMATSLIENEQIETTEMKAKEPDWQEYYSPPPASDNSWPPIMQ